MSSLILEAHDVCKSYDAGHIEALRGVTLSIEAGEYVTISGQSGSGKSTLLQLLGGLDVPTSGDVSFRGSPLGSSLSLDRYRSEQVGFVFQSFYLLPTLQAVENVQVPMLGKKSNASTRKKRAEALLREVGLEHRLRQYPNELSGGERQRVAIARALANEPSVLLADEPTGNLDSANSARIMELLTGLQRARNMTLVVVTHEEQIARSAPRHIRVHDGRIA